MKSLAPEIIQCSQGVCATKLWYLAGCPEPLFRENEPWKESRNLIRILRHYPHEPYCLYIKSLFHLRTWPRDYQDALGPETIRKRMLSITFPQMRKLTAAFPAARCAHKTVLKLNSFIRLSPLSTLTPMSLLSTQSFKWIFFITFQSLSCDADDTAVNMVRFYSS